MQRNKFVKDGKIYRTIALISFALIPVYLVMFMTGDLTSDSDLSPIAASLMMTVVLGLIGGILLRIGNKKLKCADAYNECEKRLYNGETIDIDDLAKRLNCRYDEIVVDMQILVNTGYFQNAQIDKASRKLIPLMNTKSTTIVICPHCGAQNKILNASNAICEYCDSHIDI